MNEFSENIGEFLKAPEFPNVSDLPDSNFSFEDLIKETKDFISSTKEFCNELAAEKEKVSDIPDVREYGLQECCDAAKKIFTPEKIAEWGNMTIEGRNEVIQEYSKAIAQGLNVDFKGVIFEPLMEQMSALGYNSGDGYLHLDNSFLTNPGQIITLIDTVAHEARHQFQKEAILDTGKFNIDSSTINEWTAGFNNYTDGGPTSYDPWGYHYNPVEIDARYFGESMVRELTRDLINNA